MPLKRRESKKWVFKQFQTFRMNHHDTVVKNKPFPCYSPVLRFYLCRNSSIMHKRPKSTREIMFCADNVAQQRSTLDRFLFKNTHYHLVDSTHSSTTCVPKVSQTFRVFVQTLEGVQVNLGTPFFLHFDYYCNTTWIHSYVNFIWRRLRWHQTTFETHMQSDSKTSTCSPFCSLPPRSISQMFTSSSATLLLTSCPASLWSASLASWDFIWPKVTSEHKHSHLSSLTETGGSEAADGLITTETLE